MGASTGVPPAEDADAQAGPSHVRREPPAFEANNIKVGCLLNSSFPNAFGARLMMPAIQRPFEWDAGQCKKFLEQITTAFETNDWHSLGNIFVWRENPDSEELLVMDGAHRVTCIFILMAVLRHIRNTEFNKIMPDDVKPSSPNTFKHADLVHICCNKNLCQTMFGPQNGGSLCFSPKARQVQFFAKYILSAEDNLGALWATDAPPYSRLLGIDELEFADVVTHRYAVAAHAMHQAMLTTTTKMLEGRPGALPLPINLSCSVMDRGKSDSEKGPWLLFEEFLVKKVTVVLTMVSGGDQKTCVNMFLSANEVGKALHDLDRVKARMLLPAEGRHASETIERWADEWDQTYLKLRKYTIARGTQPQNGVHAASNAFDELFVATIIGIHDPGLVHEEARKSSDRIEQSYVNERFLNELKPVPPGTFNVSAQPEFFDKWVKPNARALLVLFDWQTYGKGFNLAAGNVSAQAVLKRAVMRDTIRSRLRSISEDFFSAFKRRETTHWLPVMAQLLNQFSQLETMPLLDELLMHVHGLIGWHMVSSGHNKKKILGNYSKQPQGGTGRVGIIPDLLRCFGVSADAPAVKEELLKVLNGCRQREGAVLISRLATLTLEKNGAGPGVDLQTALLFLRVYEDALRLDAFKQLAEDKQTLELFNSTYSSVAQAAYNRGLVREKGPLQAEHFLALKAESRRLHKSWTRSKKAVLSTFRVSLGNLCLVPQSVNNSVSNEPPQKKAKMYKQALGGVIDSAAEEEAPAEAPAGAGESSSDDDDDAPAPTAPVAEEEDEVAVAWELDLKRSWSLNDILSPLGRSDLTTEEFGKRLNRMHRAIMLHLGFTEKDHLKQDGLSHFYTSSEKRHKKAPDLPGFPKGKTYRQQLGFADAPSTRGNKTKRARAAAASASDDDSDDASSGGEDEDDDEDESEEEEIKPVRKKGKR